MSPAETVTAFIEATERKDVDAAVALTAENISYENMPADPVVGHEVLAGMLNAFLGPANEVDWQIMSQFEFGTTVVNERLDRFQIGSG
jgi:limonene-1,2-epoxide hydrolase